MGAHSIDGAEIMRHYFEARVLKLYHFNRPEFATNPIELGAEGKSEVMAYLDAKHLPNFPVGADGLSFQAGGITGFKGIEYQAVLVTDTVDQKSVYLFRLKASLPEDEQELDGQGRYRWRTCGCAEKWPTHYDEVTWTNT